MTFCFESRSQSLKAAVSRDLPEPAVPIMKTIYMGLKSLSLM
jgi:hypothetical protein